MIIETKKISDGSYEIDTSSLRFYTLQKTLTFNFRKIDTEYIDFDQC